MADKSGLKRRNFMKNGWPTPSGKIEIYSEALKEEGVDPLPTYVPEIEGQEDPKRDKYPLQVLSSASHYFIGDSFQAVPRLQAMMSRPTVELSPEEASILIFCSLPVPLSLADTFRIPFASISKVTST